MINGASKTELTQLAINVSPHPQNPTQMCVITIVSGVMSFSLTVDWPTLPKIAKTLSDGQQQRPLVEVPRMSVKQ